jgi:Cyclic nucleotide-binding domain
MSVLSSVAPHLIHVGAVLYLICFLFRDQIALRIFAVAGDVAYMVYYFTVAAHPLWEAIFWIIPNMGINIVMIALILRDQRMTMLSDDEMALYQNLRGISPGQFRRLIKTGHWQRITETTTLTEEGQALERLYYVLQGDVEVDKAGRKIKVDPAVFIGELAFLRKKPATATVKVAPGAVLVSWSHRALAAITAKDEGLNMALTLLLNNDLAEKVARA